MNGHILELAGHVEDFEAAIELYDFSTEAAGFTGVNKRFDTPEELRKRNRMRHWRIIAAKDGALTLYHFGETVDAIRGGMRNCPVLRSLVDTKKLKEADKQFESDFPNYVKLRHAVAHQTVVAKAPFAAIPDGIGRIVFTGSLFDRRFVSVWNGNRVEYELSKKSLASLSKVRDLVFAAFTDAESTLRTASEQKA